MSLSYTYTDSKVRAGKVFQDYAIGTLLGSPPPSYIDIINIPAGARLPGVSRHTINAGADYDLPLAGSSFVNFHVDGAYKSDQSGNIDVTSPFYWTIPAAFMANARVTYGLSEHLSADVFVNNVTNDVGYSGGTGTQSAPTLFSGRYVARPRTYGIGVHYKF